MNKATKRLKKAFKFNPALNKLNPGEKWILLAIAKNTPDGKESAELTEEALCEETNKIAFEETYKLCSQLGRKMEWDENRINGFLAFQLEVHKEDVESLYLQLSDFLKSIKGISKDKLIHDAKLLIEKAENSEGGELREALEKCKELDIQAMLKYGSAGSA